MAQSNKLPNSYNLKEPYKSCIKINGISIIPPLLSDEIRKECQEYRRKAIHIEQKLQCSQNLKQAIFDLNKLEVKTKKLTQSIEMQMALESNSNNNSTIGKSTISPNRKLPNLVSETVEVAEYISTVADPSNAHGDSNSEHIIKPKLIRSNSYIVETPSPILLAHLEKEAKKCCPDSGDSTCSSNGSNNDNNSIYSNISTQTVVNNTVDENDPKYLLETDIKIEQIKLQYFDNNNKQLDPKLVEIIDKLSPECASKLIQVLQNKNEKQISHYQDYENFKRNLFADTTIFNPSNNNNSESRPSNLSLTSSQTLYYSVTSDPFSTPEGRDQEILLDAFGNVTENHSRFETKLKRKLSLYKNKQEWAASTIGAAIRGYLVRRLLRTEKVQLLIETIKDALLCAIQLHGADVIDQADVELHRRLLQQVSAACYAFHDLFFTLSTKEQMSIISIDRQRLYEKIKQNSNKDLKKAIAD